jgi:hypothetical protein
MLKKISWIFLVFILGCAGSPFYEGRLKITGRGAEGEIKKLLLHKTPVGSDWEQVAHFINEDLYHQGGHVPFIESTDKYYSHVRLLPTGDKKSEQDIYAVEWIPPLDPRLLISHNPFINVTIYLDIFDYQFLKTYTIAEWKFNKQGKLMAIQVSKKADSL